MLRLALQQRRPVWARASSSSLLSALDQQRCMSSETKLVKRKVALVAAYLGTGYHGVQLNENVSTIEDDLRQAIFKAGAMRESNFVDLRKIDWSRSSRTDKGVHAGCIVVGACMAHWVMLRSRVSCCVCALVLWQTAY